jgi:glycyl-tRNA synthetase beta chain
MADLLIEIICEEIPARMQPRAMADLQRMMLTRLDDAGLSHGTARGFVAPRHLALYVDDVAERQPDISEERRGPRADAPDKAIDGFLKSTGLNRDQLVEEDTPKGRFLFARIEKKGVDAATLLPAMVSGVLTEFPWPKSQRWGGTRFRWVRPLHRVNLLFGGAALAGELDLGGATLDFTMASRGHYFESPYDIDLAGITGAGDYVARLRSAHVMVDRAERRQAILDGATDLAAGAGSVLRPNEALIDEICGLVEWPTPLFGAIEDRFMALPDEVLEASIRTHQKYLTTGDADNALQPGFVVISNRLADVKRDAVILAGNQRVLRARLADAEFFWQEDSQNNLESRLSKLADVTFYDGLGSVTDKVARLEKLAGAMAPSVDGCDADMAVRAARLAKGDLVTGMVGEFPELQGIMGGYYARNDGEADAVAEAVAAHYRPQGPSDALPASPEGCVVSLADKIDSLVGFFGVGARPTGSKDPFALRRAALGIIRIILEARIRMPLLPVLAKAATAHGFAAPDPELEPFIRERLRVSLRETGLAHDVVAAALGDGTGPGHDDILGLADRAAALSTFLAGDDGAGLVAGWRRAASILEAEESKTKQVFSPTSDPHLFVEDAETGLHAALGALPEPGTQMQTRDELLAVMQSLGGLRQPIDRFFDGVVVNHDDAATRLNRLGLLAMVRQAMQRVADFSRLEG